MTEPSSNVPLKLPSVPKARLDEETQNVLQGPTLSPGKYWYASPSDAVTEILVIDEFVIFDTTTLTLFPIFFSLL